MVEYNGDFWKRHLLFRDYLRAHPHTAREYYKLKKELAAKYRLNRDAYTEAKTLFIESLVSRASGSDRLKRGVITKRSDQRGQSSKLRLGTH
jgi:GrpB-like predicted nucleotidyltransferase (UPF0157 family)